MACRVLSPKSVWSIPDRLIPGNLVVWGPERVGLLLNGGDDENMDVE